MQKRLWALICLAILVCAWAVPAGAAPADAAPSTPAVSVEAQAGYDGKAKAGTWVPVTITLKNEGAEFEGAIQFEVKNNLGPGVHTGIYRTPVTVPAGATKRLQVSVPAEFTGLPSIQLMGGGKQLGTVSPKIDMTRDILVGVLGVEPAELPAIAGLPRGDRTLRLIKLDGDALPVEPLLLQSFDAILLDRFTYSELPELQRKALQTWVEHGGTLLAAGGPEAARLAGLAPWVPLSVKSVENVTVEGVGQAPLSRFDLTFSSTGWQPVRQSGGELLAAVYHKGMGSVSLLTFDPALQPFASWKGMPDLFVSLLPMGGDPIMGMGGKGVQQKGNMVMIDSLGQFPIREIPATRGLLTVLIGYALLIGPVHFLLLRGFKRLGWALLTLPILASAGGAGAWYYTREAAASDMMVNAVAVLEGQPGGTSIRVQGLTGFLVPPASTHKVSIGGSLLSPVPVPFMPFMQQPGGRSTEIKTTFEEYGRLALIGPQEEWTLYALGSEAMVPVAGTVTGAVTLSADRLTGKVTNNLPYPLENVVVASGASFQRLGNLKPGQSADVSLMQSAIAMQGGSDNPLAEMLARSNEFRGFGQSGPTPEEFRMMRRAQMSWAAASAVSWVRSAKRPPVVLAGWADNQPLAVTIDGRKASVNATALYVQPVTVTVADGEFSLPAGWTLPRSVEWNGTSGGGAIVQGWNMAKGDSAVLEFGVPAYLANRVTELELRMPSLGKGSSGAYPVKFAFYRWADKAWVEVPEELEGANPPNSPAFVGPDGTVRVKITQVVADRMPLSVPGLTVRGKGVGQR